MRYRGAVNYYVNLPANPVQGDVWVVRYQGASGQTPNGHAYCWENAPVTTDRTYIGDVAAYTNLVNHQSDIINWLKDKEQKGIAWAGFIFGNNITFMAPSSTIADEEGEYNRGDFLYPLVYRTLNGSIYNYKIRKSDKVSNSGSNFRGNYAFDWRHYYSPTNTLIVLPSAITYRLYNGDSTENVTINNVLYTSYAFGRVSPGSVSSPPTNTNQYQQYFGNNTSSTIYYDCFTTDEASTVIGNFVSSRPLLDVNGVLVEPGPTTYTLCYAGTEEALQWVDLGDLGGNLPSGKGKIYYNGICYSAGGGESGKFFHREEIDTTTSNLIVVDNSTFTNPNSTPLAENIILLNESELTLIADSENECNSNIIAQEGGLITGKKISNNIILGKYNYIYSDNYFKNAIILGQSNHYASSTTPNSDSNPILIGYNNTVECDGALETSTVDVPYILLGSNNTAYEQSDTENSYYVAAIGNSNTVKGTKSIAIGYNVIVSGEYTNSLGTSYWGNNTVLGNEINVSGSYIKALGRSINFGNSSEMVLIGQILNGANAYESAVIGYYNSMASSTCCGVFGANTYTFAGNYYTYAIGVQNQATSSYYSYILGYYNRINGSNFGHIVGYNNTINSCSYQGAYIFGYTNSLSAANDSYVIGQENTVTGSMYNYAIGKNIYLLNGSNNNLIFGKGIELTSFSDKIRIGYYPLTNNDFFAIGDGEDSSRSSVFRIDANKNFYLNSTVPLPPVPSADGTYTLSVASGASSWVTGGGGSSVVANPSGSATDSLTKISIDNIIYSLSGTGTYVEANPSGTGSTDLTSVEIGSTIYNIPQGVNVVANPSGTASTDLTSLEVGSTVYSIPQGTSVTANPSGSATDTLNKLQVGSTIYSIPSGGGLIVSGTLAAGATSITLSDAGITTSAMVDIYTDEYGVNPTDAVVTNGSITLTFAARQTALNIKVCFS